VDPATQLQVMFKIVTLKTFLLVPTCKLAV
jgi:hypothetical protein